MIIEERNDWADMYAPNTPRHIIDIPIENICAYMLGEVTIPLKDKVENLKIWYSQNPEISVGKNIDKIMKELEDSNLFNKITLNGNAYYYNKAKLLCKHQEGERQYLEFPNNVFIF